MICTMPPSSASALLAPEIVKDFDPGQPRDDHGRWSKLGAAVHAIEQAVKAASRFHETFGGPHGQSDTHGVVLHHGPAGISISSHDAEIGTVHHMTIPESEADDLRSALETAWDYHRGRHDEWTDAQEYEGDGWALYWNEEGATLNNPDAEDMYLSPSDVETLETALSSALDFGRNSDNPYVTRPLDADEEMIGKKVTIRTRDNDDIFLATVATPSGPHMRMGLGGSEAGPASKWTGGRGPMVADLDPERARAFSDALDEVTAEMDEHETKLGQADDLMDAWGETPAGKRFRQLTNSVEAGGDGWGIWHTGDGVQVKRLRERNATGWRDDDYEQAPPELAKEILDLNEQQNATVAHLGLVDEGDTINTHSIETPWGIIEVESIGLVEGYDTLSEALFRIRPHGMSDDAWGELNDQYETGARLTLSQVDSLNRRLMKFVKDHESVDKILKMAIDQPRDPDGKWSHNPFGMAKGIAESLESEYGPILDADSWQAGPADDDTRGWVSLHENGDYVLSYEDGDAAKPFMDNAMASAYWARLPDNLRDMADAMEDGETGDSLEEGPDGDPAYSLNLYEGDGGTPGVSLEAGTDGFSIEDPDEARDLADKIDWLLERRDAWSGGEYDDDYDPDDEGFEFDGEPDGDADDVQKLAGGKGHGGSSWEEQWKHGKLAKKWIGHPHPWTALYHHLRKHMPDEMAKRTAAQWHHDVFGIWPGEKKGKNPVGPG